MIVSLNWLKKFTSISGTIDELVTLIGSRLVEIEGVENIGEKYKDVVVAKVVECKKLEGSDHLSLTKIDDGGVVSSVDRDESGLIQVVCGATNVREGMLVAWLPPNSVVPETYGSAEPFVLGAKPLRGAMSSGMLASARELDLYDDHTGIIEIDKDATPGDSFAKIYELDDYLLDIENKSLTHRPDAFGVIGFAREVSGIQGLPFESPAWLDELTSQFDNTSSVVEAPAVVIEDRSLSDRFQAIVLSDMSEGASSPIQIQTYLARCGIRPINASVDISNYLMLLTGQPTHTYDYDKLKAIAGDDFSIRVRLAKRDEKLILLDGKEASLDEADIVIAAGDTAVGLAGIMGGQSTAVDSSTKNILLEVATFDLYRMRSSQMRHGVFSEAVTRFTKGIPAKLGTPVLNEAIRLLGDYTGARLSSPVVEDYPANEEDLQIKITESKINGTLGTRFSADDIASLLRNVGFSVEFDGLAAIVTVPYWRKDIKISEDIIEEVGRLAGYDTINPTLPRRDFSSVRPVAFDIFRASLRKTLARAGANEVLTYSFVHGDTLEKANQSSDNSYKIVNSISPDLQYYRQSLTPSLLSHIFMNTKAGYESFAMFEINKVHQKSDGLNKENVPVEQDSLAFIVTDLKKSGAAYYDAKLTLEYLSDVLGLELAYEQLQQNDICARCAPFEPKRSASVTNAKTGQKLGVVGEFKRSVQKAFKLPAYTAGFEVDLRALHQSFEQVGSTYTPLGRYPGTERDICFQVSKDTVYSKVFNTANSSLRSIDRGDLAFKIEPVDIYQPDTGDIKNITIRINLASYEKTMTNEEISELINQVIESVIQETGGRVI